MVTIKVNGKNQQFCTSWDDVKYDRVMNAATMIDEIAGLSDVPHETLLNANPVSLFPLYTLVSFVDDEELKTEDVSSIIVAREKELRVKTKSEAGNIVELDSYDRMEHAKAALKEGKPYQKLLKVAKVYFPDENKTVRLLSLGVAIVEMMEVFLENYKEMYEAKLSADEESAGFGRLSDLGSFWTAFNLAGKDPLKIDEVLERPAIVIYTILWGSFIENQCQKELIRIRTPKNDIPASGRGNKGRR